MSDSVAGRLVDRGPEWRATIYYFTQYMSGAVATVYAGIWFTSKGISSAEIGLINALPVLLTLALNLVVGRIADRAPDWRQTIIIGAMLAAAIPFGLFAVHDFVGILIVWTLLTLPANLVGPVVDAATLRMTRRRGSDFGPIRAWGTVGYMVVMGATGALVTLYGGGVFLPLFVGLSLLRGLVALGLPRFRAPGGEAAAAPTLQLGRLRDMLRPGFFLPLLGWSMVFSTHLVLNAFQGLLWKQQGMSEALIAPLLALGALAEASMMFVYPRIARRMRVPTMILLSALAAVLRWTMMAFSPDIPLLIPLQLLHAVTFALGYMACVNFIAGQTREDIAAEAQSLFQMMQQAMSVIALAGFGWLTGLFGAQAYFVAAAFALLGGGLIVIGTRRG